jgi:hypothetical protein
VYEPLRGISRNAPNKKLRLEIPQEFSRWSQTKQWLIHGVVVRFFFFARYVFHVRFDSEVLFFKSPN